MINYQLLADSVNFYTDKGFKRIETPWTVSAYVDDITKPKDRPHYQLKHNDKCLVASGEQSFLYLYLKEYLPKGSFQTITPCFRYESYDLYHEKCFMKNELIVTDNVTNESLRYVIDSAYDFFKKYLNGNRLHVVSTSIGYDIEYNIGDSQTVELGSYGIRRCKFLKWIYGTGCAEPRLSKVMEYRNG